jgi:hypothetical protein
MPAFEFWFSGFAVSGAAAFLFTAAIAVITIQGHSAYRYALWLLPFIALGYWYTQAKSEADKAKPGRDYVYFDVIKDPRDNDGKKIRLVSFATGPLKDVAVAIQTDDERKKGSRIYIFGARFLVINEGPALLDLALPRGDYWIDADQPAKLGQILEHLLIDDNLTATISVTRKETHELLALRPEIISFSDVIVLSLICLAFMSFAGALGWASWASP